MKSSLNIVALLYPMLLNNNKPVCTSAVIKNKLAANYFINYPPDIQEIAVKKSSHEQSVFFGNI